MKSLCISVVALCLTTATVQAQDASQWAGAYGGLTYSTGEAFQTYEVGPTSFDLEGDGPGLILGYNYTTGPWVLGGELAYSKVEIGELPPNTDYTFTSFLDVKARAGYAMDNVLIYGTVGGTFTQWQEGAGDGGFDGDGFLYGLGVDYLVTPRMFVGADYIVREVTSKWNNLNTTFDANPSTFTLRVGMKF